MSVVRRDRLDVKFGRESTRWNISLSFTEDGWLRSSESSQSEESSSSSIALSDTPSSSSSSSVSKTASWCAALPTATSSLNDVCFLLLEPLKLLCGRLRLSDSWLLYMWLSNELSSSPEEVPMVNMAPFFLAVLVCANVGGGFLRIGVGCAATRFVCER